MQLQHNHIYTDGIRFYVAYQNNDMWGLYRTRVECGVCSPVETGIVGFILTEDQWYMCIISSSKGEERHGVLYPHDVEADLLPKLTHVGTIVQNKLIDLLERAQ